jgi:hypothetical protein
MLQYLINSFKFLIVPLSLLLFSCEKEKELATKIEVVKSFQGFNFQFIYDDLGRVSKITGGHQAEFNYQYYNDSTIVNFTYHESGNIREERTTRVYYANSLVTKIIIRFRRDQDIFFDTLTLNYDASNRLVAFNDTSPVVVDKNNNITSSELKGFTYSFKFDNKPNPFKGIPGFGFVGYSWRNNIVSPLEVISFLGSNNITEYLYSGQPTNDYRFNIGYKSGMPVSYVWEKWEGTSLISVQGYVQDIQCGMR